MALLTRKELCVIHKCKPQRLTDVLHLYKDANFPSPVAKRGNYLLYNDKEVAKWFENNDLSNFKVSPVGRKVFGLDADLARDFISGKYDCDYKKLLYFEKFKSIHIVGMAI